MKPETKTATRPDVWELKTHEEEMTLCEIVRYLDLRAMHQSNGESSALRELVTGCYLDAVWSNITDRTTRADQLKALAKAERAIADKARQTISCVRITDEERTEAYNILSQYSTLADNNSGEAQDIEKSNNALTASLAQDMLHTIYIELQTIKADPDRQTEKAFSDLCKVGRQFVQSFTAVTTIDSVNTISRPLSVAEARYYMTRYTIDPKARPRQKWTQTAKGCTGYYTLEAKTRKKDTDPAKVDPAIIANYARYNDACIWYYENVTLQTTHSGHETAFPALDAKAIATRFWNRQTPTQKAIALDLDPAENPVLYLVLHVPTIRKQTPVDTMTDHDPRTAETVAESTLAQVDIVALAERAKLSQQARIAIEALTHPEAIKTAREAHRKAMEDGKRAIEKLQEDRAKAGKKPYSPGIIRQQQQKHKQTADNAYTAILWKYALTLAGYSQSAQAKAKSVLITKLTQAYHNAPDSLTPGKVDFAKLMKQTRRGHAQNNSPRPDYVTIWTEQGAQAPKHKPVIRWTESGHSPEAVNPGKDYRAEAIERAEAITRANNEADQTRRAEARAEAERIRAEREEARRKWSEEFQKREAVTITPAQWNGWTPEQRKTHIRTTSEAGKRTEFATA